MGALKETGRPLSQVKRVPYEEAFLIEDLLTSRLTILSGEPKTGKTLLAVGMVTALLNGDDDFLGQRVHRRVEHVAFGLTDDGAEEELHERFVASDRDKITSFSALRIGSEGSWSEVARELVESRADLFVYDNILGGLGAEDDIASSLTAANVVKNLRRVVEAGIPVLAVTHTAKGNSEGLSVASSPIGGRALAGGARGIIALRMSRDGGRVIETAINRARENLRLPVEVTRPKEDSELPLWTIRQPRAAGPSKRKSADDRAREMAARILAEQPSENSWNAVAMRYAGGFGWSPETARKHLAKFITYDEEAETRWVPVGEPEAQAAEG